MLDTQSGLPMNSFWTTAFVSVVEIRNSHKSTTTGTRYRCKTQFQKRERTSLRILSNTFLRNLFYCPSCNRQPTIRACAETFSVTKGQSQVRTYPPRIIVAGAPASGKGTQCKKIAERYGVVHLSTGDMLREAVQNGTELGKMAKQYMDSGRLVPDDLVIGMLKERLKQEDCEKHGWLLDGFPRTASQAQALLDAKIYPDLVLVLDVPESELIQRVVGRRLDPVTGRIYHLQYSPPEDQQVLSRLIQRTDDTEEKAKVRLDTYYTHIQAIEEQFSQVVHINGNRHTEHVFSDIVLNCNLLNE
ncbi:Adenylate kinase 2, chloroplastic [Galdieria sulphuraria]|nr:Adenylate kinase 2, chloroplastic [Galdieria sulphuraria]